MSSHPELEKLLSDEEILKRVPSNRFQVSRTEACDEEDDSRPVREVKSLSEPPLPTAVIDRKMSLNGRFMVQDIQEEEPTNETNPLMSPSECQVDDDDSQPMNTSKVKGVKFSVGEKNGNEDQRRDTTEGNTTLNMKSWRNMRTIEHPPIMDFYRNSVDVGEGGHSRPTMSQLIHGEKVVPEDISMDQYGIGNSGDLSTSDVEKKSVVQSFNPPQQQNRVKFGWIQGVFVRCLLNIFGVMLYLRISWVAGQAGIGLGCAIVLLASLVTTITALSTCAICTNGDVKGGGAYFLISRSLGPEFGGSIGLIFSVANAVGAAMYVVGFAETVRDILVVNEMTIVDGDIWDVRIIGFVTSCVLMGIVFIGTAFESRMQMGLLVILGISILNYIAGSVLPPSDMMMKRGATGYSWNTFVENFTPNFQGEDFFSVFSVYFPAATGIMAGANISGDLANPQTAIPKGTLLAIAVTTVTYLVTVVMTGSTCVRYSDGEAFPIHNGTNYLYPNCSVYTEADKDLACKFGLMHYFQVMEMESLWGPLITAGIFAATLSSALASLVSAPKVFQAVCKDRLYPKIGYFAKAYGKDEEPRRAYFLAFFICILIVGIGELNAIAPIISNFFLASYALINYACFDQSFADSPGFRPSFKWYNMWVSLAGSLLCIFVMFIISWSTALITFFCFAAGFLYILHRKPDVNWGSSTQAHSYKNAITGMVKLSNTEDHVKNYRPQFLVLCGSPAARPSLVDFAYNISKGTSLMICGYVLPCEPSDRMYSVMRRLERDINGWLKKRKVKSFYSSVANPSLRFGAQNLIQISGLGRLKPNIVMMGFKSNWYYGGPTEETLKDLNEYFCTIQDVFDSHMGVCVLRNGGSGLDHSEAMKLLNIGETSRLKISNLNDAGALAKDISSGSMQPPPSEIIDEEKQAVEKSDDEALHRHKGSARSLDRFIHDNNHYMEASNSLAENFPFDLDDEDEDSEEKLEEEAIDMDVETGKPHLSDDERRNHHTFSLRRRNSRRATVEQKALIANICRFQRKIEKGTIDVWWLYDDGGLTLLVPHLLTIPKSYLEGAKLRVFTISTSSRTMEQEQRGLAALLSKFRIDFSQVKVVADIGRHPKKETMAKWESLIEPWIGLDGNAPQGMTTPSELAAQKEKTYRQLRAGELLEQHSRDADLIVLTLPVPRKGLVSASLYMSWLDVMTRNLPPTLLVRGNQSSVLTFYS